jgi:hypothetical protein
MHEVRPHLYEQVRVRRLERGLRSIGQELFE